MFQIHVRHVDVTQNRKLHNNMEFEFGQWYHVGWSYYNEVATGYENGCLNKKDSSWSDDPDPPDIHESVDFGHGAKADNAIDLLIDEVYLWDVRKPSRVFSALYH